MRKKVLLMGIFMLAVSLQAQTPKKSLVLVHRFDAISLNSNGGSLTNIREFDFAIVTPGKNAYAKSWVPTVAFNALWGDAHGDGNYTRFYKWKSSYFERFNFHGLFIKYKDISKGDPKLIYFTIRDDRVGKVFKVFTNNGTKTHQVRCGDFFRFLPNGNIEFFITQDLIMKAAGPQSGSYRKGASALCQDSKGNLYYSPAEGGHWVHGAWLNDGGIAMIRAQDITYDANGNVKDVKSNCAFRIFGEVATGPIGQPSLRMMVQKANAKDYKGNQIRITYNLCGLALDPNGGTITASFPDPNTNKYPVVPNFIFGGDSGGWANTIFSTKNGGSIAVINGVQMGTQTGKADGSWCGMKADPSKYTPTLMGFCVIDEVKDVFTADAPNDGAILSSDTKIQIDIGYMKPSTPVVMFFAAGPAVPGKFILSFDMSGALGPGSFGWIFLTTPPIFSLNLGVANQNGFINFSTPKPTDPIFKGKTLIFHAAKLNFMPSLSVSVSNPLLLQFK